MDNMHKYRSFTSHITFIEVILRPHEAEKDYRKTVVQTNMADTGQKFVDFEKKIVDYKADWTTLV